VERKLSKVISVAYLANYTLKVNNPIYDKYVTGPGCGVAFL
jgi:hypothetical protein